MCTGKGFKVYPFSGFTWSLHTTLSQTQPVANYCDPVHSMRRTHSNSTKRRGHRNTAFANTTTPCEKEVHLIALLQILKVYFFKKLYIYII